MALLKINYARVGAGLGLVLAVLVGSSNALAVTADDVVCDKCVETSDIANGAVDTAKIKSHAVTNGKIAAGAVSTAKIKSRAVTNGKIATGAVDTAKIKSHAVTNGKIAAGAVTTAKIANGAVTAEKLDSLVLVESTLTYIGPLSSVEFDCSDPLMNEEPFVEEMTLTLTEQIGDNVTGTVTLTSAVDPDVTSGPINATVYPFGHVAGTATVQTHVNGILESSSTVELMITVTAMGEMMTVHAKGRTQFVSGETCQFYSSGLIQVN